MTDDEQPEAKNDLSNEFIGHLCKTLEETRKRQVRFLLLSVGVAIVIFLFIAGYVELPKNSEYKGIRLRLVPEIWLYGGQWILFFLYSYSFSLMHHEEKLEKEILKICQYMGSFGGNAEMQKFFAKNVAPQTALVIMIDIFEFKRASIFFPCYK